MALGLAGLALIVFVTWNFLPYYEYEETTSRARVMMVAWPEIFSPDIYIDLFESPDMDDFIDVSAFLSLIQNGILILLAVPLWKILHASGYVRLPLAILNLLGGGVILWMMYDIGLDDPTPLWIETFLLISFGMFAISAALFTFKNELELRNARSEGRLAA
ncbi:MAG: hypothetical protein ABJQ29_12150 [Luteolibacter sp.]